MRINQNIMALNAYRNLSTNNTSMSKTLEKLSSGYRINRAADDAAGLVISQALRAQVSGLRQATRNAQDGVSVVQTAEGALVEVHSMLNRMRDLAVQASNTGANDAAARAAAQAEVDQLAGEITRVASTTKFGSTNLLNGSYGGVRTPGSTTGTAVDISGGLDLDGEAFALQVDGGAALTVDLNTDGITTLVGLQSELQTSIDAALTGAGLTAGTVTANVTGTPAAAVVHITRAGVGSTAAGSGVSLMLSGASTALTSLGFTNGAEGMATGGGGVFQVGADANETINVAISAVDATSLGVNALTLSGNAAGAITAIDAAIADVSELRGDLGAKQNRFESVINNLQVSVENLAASESRIRDTDYALEMVKFTRDQILTQAGTAMLGQANQLPQSVLSLLRG